MNLLDLKLWRSTILDPKVVLSFCLCCWASAFSTVTSPAQVSVKMEEETIYLRNFQKALSTVDDGNQEYSDLFDHHEKTLCEQFLRGNGTSSMSMQARGVYTRMFQRKGPWFRLESIMHYPELLCDRAEEIDDKEKWVRTEGAIRALEQFGFVSYVGSRASCEKAKVREQARWQRVESDPPRWLKRCGLV